MKNRPINRSSSLPQYTYRQSVKKENTKIYRRVALIIATSFVILLVVWFMGVTFLGFVGNIANGNKPDNTPKKTSNLPLQTPSIDKLPSVTSTSKIIVSGSTSANVSVDLSVNSKALNQITSDSSGSFQFSDVNLEPGLNLIKVTASDDAGKNAESSTTITLDTTKPALAIATPVDGASYPSTTKTVTVSGTTEPQAKVFVNNSQSVVDSTGKFSYNLPVVAGANTIEVKSTDQAGNITTATVTITVEVASTP